MGDSTELPVWLRQCVATATEASADALMMRRTLAVAVSTWAGLTRLSVSACSKGSARLPARCSELRFELLWHGMGLAGARTTRSAGPTNPEDSP